MTNQFSTNAFCLYNCFNENRIPNIFSNPKNNVIKNLQSINDVPKMRKYRTIAMTEYITNIQS